MPKTFESGPPKDVTECARLLLTLADWRDAPYKTEWSAGMIEAIVMLTKDETMTVYVHRKALTLLAKPSTP